jgi:hypothetical protein
MNSYDQVYIFMETNTSKGVGEHYFCIPECTYWQHMWMMLGTAAAVA